MVMIRRGASVVSASVFGVIAVQFVGWKSLLYPWRFIDSPLHLLLAVSLLGLTYVIRALRLYRYFRLRDGFGSCVRLLLQHTMLANLLPLRAGELAFPALMKHYFSVPLNRSFAALLWLRVLDLHAVLWITILLGAAVVEMAPVLVAAIAISWLLLPLAVSYSAQSLTSLLGKRDTRLLRALRDVLAAVPQSFGKLVENWLLTLLNWGLKLAVFAWIIQVFSALGYRSSLAGAIGGELSGVVPIQGFANFGTYEAGVVAAMRVVGVAVNDALTGALNLHLFSLGVSICGGLLAFLIPKPGRPHVADGGRPGETRCHDKPTGATIRYFQA
jgi:hypothetical protein